MDIKHLMDMANQLRGQLADAHAAAADQRFTGEAGGGMVRVVINGRHEVMAVEIDKAAVDPNDLTLLEDLVRAAFNQANGQVVAGLRDQVGSLAQGLGIDPGLLHPDGQGRDPGAGDGSK